MCVLSHHFMRYSLVFSRCININQSILMPIFCPSQGQSLVGFKNGPTFAKSDTMQCQIEITSWKIFLTENLLVFKKFTNTFSTNPNELAKLNPCQNSKADIIHRRILFHNCFFSQIVFIMDILEFWVDVIFCKHFWWQTYLKFTQFCFCEYFLKIFVWRVMTFDMLLERLW